MSNFTPGPYKLDHSGGATYVCTADSDINLCRVTAQDQIANSHLFCAAPDMFAAIDAADTAFAVLNVQDLDDFPQARQCIREAWPLVQSARAKARPDSGYADAVKEVQQHEIARLDGIIADMRDRLADIASVLKDCPGVDVGNSKVHYAYHVAQGASNDQA